MSYEIVRSIKIDEKQQKVFITCASNNSRPLDYRREEYPSFSKILKEEGKEAVEIALLRNYEEGNLQRSDNKYTKALRVLRYIFAEEYKKFNWRNHNARWGTKEYKAERELRYSDEFNQLLIKAIDYKIQKGNFIITKKHFGEIVYGKRCPTCMKWTRLQEKATKYKFKAEAEDHIFKEFKNEWEVQEDI